MTRTDLSEPATQEHEPAPAPAPSQNFVETALKLSGKSEEEARTTGSIDRADDQVEALFAPRYQTSQSPVHRAVWGREFPLDLFQPRPADVPNSCRGVMDESLAIVRRHRDAGTLYDEHKKIAESVLRELAGAGYWGLLVDPEYGGLGTPFATFAPFL